MVPYERFAGSPSGSEVRAIYLSLNVQKLLDTKSSDIGNDQKAGIYARLNRFVEGARLSVSTDEIGDGKGDIKCLKGYDKKLFQLRFYDVAPQYRMLGVFPQFDVFLAFCLLLREDLENEWNANCNRVLAKLRSMGTSAPECLDGSDISKVLSNWTESR